MFHSKSNANTSRYKNPEVDALLDRARETFDQDDRKKLYFKAQELMTQDLPFIPLFFSVEFAAMRDNVHGYVWIPDEIPRFRDVWKSDLKAACDPVESPDRIKLLAHQMAERDG